MTDNPQTKSILQVRKERDERIRSNQRNWLALAGLFLA